MSSRFSLAVLPFLATGLFVCSTTVSAEPTERDSAAVTYERDVRPILKAYCFQCHGEETELSGGLDLRLRKLIVRGGDSGPAIVAGKPEESLLLDYVVSGEMPPQDELQLSEDEIEVIRSWVRGGAAAGSEPDEVPDPGEFFVTEAERSHWAFQPIEKPEPPVSETGIENPIDAFVGEQLRSSGLEFSPRADRVTLIRRATFDLTGLPPAPDEVARFLADESPDAYEKLIDRLLASPHYGERWARHWLDVVGYADSEGYTDSDVPRPDAWLYRDYVVRSFNQDKPWDRFITEQLAGDELAGVTHGDAEKRANTDADVRDQLIATGFLRMAPDGTGASPMDASLARQATVTETIKIVSSSLLGMTIGCAECHDHRFDPISQKDFYRLRAVLAPVFDEGNWRTPQNRRVALLSAKEQAEADALEQQAKELMAEHDRIKDETVELIFQRVLETIPDQRREFAIEAYRTASKERNEEQNTLLRDEFPMLNVSAGRLHLFLQRYPDGNELKKKYETFLEQANKLRAQKPKPTYLRPATEDPKHVPQTFVFYRGDRNSPLSEPVQPGGGLSVLGDHVAMQFEPECDQLPSTGRRLAFAKSLVGGDHPLVPRVLVNRFWMHHFGKGLVDSPGDFGVQGGLPSHPQLLDWLAADFVENGWRLKRFHKQVMLSRTYQQASRRNAEFEQIDVDNRLLWRMPLRRLEAEAVRDAILAASGTLDAVLGGQPATVAVGDAGLVEIGSETAAAKRSLYIQQRRSQPLYLLEAFDSPNMEPNCERRVTSTVATQSLTMLNDTFVVAQAGAFADRVIRETGPDADAADQVQRVWQIALSREPRPNQLRSLVDYLEQQIGEFESRNVKQPRRQALASLCQVVFSGNPFLYVE